MENLEMVMEKYFVKSVGTLTFPRLKSQINCNAAATGNTIL